MPEEDASIEKIKAELEAKRLEVRSLEERLERLTAKAIGPVTVGVDDGHDDIYDDPPDMDDDD